MIRTILDCRNMGKRHFIVIVAEGAGDATEIALKIEEATGIESRPTILGHLQRGGSPTAFDRILASLMGAKAVELLKQGIGNKVISIKDNHIVDFDIEEALTMKRTFNTQLYDLAQILSM